MAGRVRERAEDRARIGELRALYRMRYPQCRRLFFERFPFDWAILNAEGRLVPGQSLACFDHGGSQAILLDIASGDALY